MIYRPIGRMRFLLPALLAWGVFGWASVHASGLSVGAGSISLGGGTMELGCGNVSVSGGANLSLQTGRINSAGNVLIDGGSLNGHQGTVELNGNWTNSGVFNPGTSTIEVLDDCDTNTTLTGDSVFWNLIAAGVAKTLFFNAGSRQHVLNVLTLEGTGAGDRLMIRSTSSGNPGFLELAQAGIQNIEFVDVRDNHAPLPGQHLAPGPPANFNSIDSGGNFRWFLNDLRPDFIPIPALSLIGLLLMILLMPAAAFMRRYRFHSSQPPRQRAW